MLNSEDTTAFLLKERLGLTAFIAAVTRDYHLSEDIFQEVCVKAVGRAEGFETPQHLLNWCRVTARHRAIDILRVRDGRYAGLKQEVLALLEQDWPGHQEVGRLAALDALDACLDKLTAHNQELVRLRYFEGRSGQQVAHLLNRKVEAVYQALARSHKFLADCVSRRLTREVS